ncbi:MAG TPA: zinc-binding dehydrogenase, partial [Pyrinomonadaceae bacterium]|nr:zinc-binding dehydrogenase [Pyrinomonadaceae bacterium]
AQAINTLTNSQVTLIGKHSSKLGIARRRGIETVLLADLQNVRRDFDVVIEASGATSGFALALDLVRPRGVIILKSTFYGAPEFNAARIVVDEISVVGSRCGRFAPALDLLERNAVDVESLISEDYALGDAVKAMGRAGAPGVLKVLLRPQRSTEC